MHHFIQSSDYLLHLRVHACVCVRVCLPVCVYGSAYLCVCVCMPTSVCTCACLLQWLCMWNLVYIIVIQSHISGFFNVILHPWSCSNTALNYFISLYASSYTFCFLLVIVSVLIQKGEKHCIAWTLPPVSGVLAFLVFVSSVYFLQFSCLLLSFHSSRVYITSGNLFVPVSVYTCWQPLVF